MFKPRAHTSTHNRCTIGKAIHEYMLTVICGRILAFKFNVKNIRRIFIWDGERSNKASTNVYKQSKHKLFCILRPISYFEFDLFSFMTKQSYKSYFVLKNKN